MPQSPIAIVIHGGAGTIARAACVCFPTENTHGYEMAHFESIINTGRMLGAYAANPKL